MKQPKFNLGDKVVVNCASVWNGSKAEVIHIEEANLRPIFTIRMDNGVLRSFYDPELLPFEHPLERQEFYELMQSYRHCPKEQQAATCEAFEAVKTYIRTHLKDMV